MVVLPLTIALGLILGRLAGGDLRGLMLARLRGELVLVAVFLVQVALPLFRLQGLHARLAYAVWFATYPVLVLVCLLNVRVPGMVLVASGLTANAAVIGANGGMPVSPSAVSAVASGARLTIERGDFVHVLIGAASRLPVLADVLPVPGPPGLRSVASVGDILLVCGVATTVLGSMLCARNSYRE